MIDYRETSWTDEHSGECRRCHEPCVMTCRAGTPSEHPLPVMPHPKGVWAHAPPGTRSARRAYERGGVSIAELLSTGLLPYGSSCLKPWAFGPTTTKYSILPAPLVKRGYPLGRWQMNPSWDDHGGQRWMGNSSLVPDAALVVPVISRQVWNCCAIF